MSGIPDMHFYYRTFSDFLGLLPLGQTSGWVSWWFRNFYQYSDDTQLYMSVRPRSATNPFRTLSLCVDDVCWWLLQNRLQLNSSKTEAVLFSTRIQRSKVPTSGGIDVVGTLVSFRDSQVAWCDASLSCIRGLARHQGCPQLQLSHTGTAAHPTVTDALCCPDAVTQHCHI